jgi:hypothetical protein
MTLVKGASFLIDRYSSYEVVSGGPNGNWIWAEVNSEFRNPASNRGELVAERSGIEMFSHQQNM